MGTEKKLQEKAECNHKDCEYCKQGNVCGPRIFCGLYRKFVSKPRDDGIKVMVCSRFEVEPLEYKVFRRA